MENTALLYFFLFLLALLIASLISSQCKQRQDRREGYNSYITRWPRGCNKLTWLLRKNAEKCIMSEMDADQILLNAGCPLP